MTYRNWYSLSYKRKIPFIEYYYQIITLSLHLITIADSTLQSC